MNIEFIPGIIGDAELCFADSGLFTALKPLLDDKLSKRLLEFWDNFSKKDLSMYPVSIQNLLKERVELSKQILKETVNLNTFHTLDRTRNLVQILGELTPSSVKYYTNSLEELLEELEWLLSQRVYWQNTIEVRKLNNFNLFLKYISDLDEVIKMKSSSGILESVGLNPYSNLHKRTIDNKEAFYSPHEKRRSTQIHLLFSRAEELHVISTGIKYTLYCQQKHISLYERRYF